MQLRCEDCALQPHLKDCRGCGYAPWRDHDDPTLKHYDAKLGRSVSPAEMVRMGLMPYRNYGYGGTEKEDGTGFEGGARMDWPWCPRWFAEFSKATVGGGPTAVVMRQAYDWREKGQLGLLYPGPFTPGFHSLLSWIETLESWDEARRKAKARAQAKTDAEAAARLAGKK